MAPVTGAHKLMLGVDQKEAWLVLELDRTEWSAS